MKISHFLPMAAVAFLSSCGSSPPDMSQPALTGIRTPVYEGMVSAMQGTQYAWLDPLTTVYVQGDSLKVGDAGYVKVWWNDSTGYVPAGWVMPGWSTAVLSVPDGTTGVYTNELLTISADATFGDWQLIPVGNVTDNSVRTMYDVEGEPAFGYIGKQTVFLDPLDLAFYDEFMNADGSVGSYEALRNSEKYASCKLALAKFGDLGPDVELIDGWDEETVNYHQDPTWYRDENHAQLTSDEYPGEFALNYMWEDSTLSEINHFGDTLGNGYESCMPDFHQTVAKYIVAFTPKEAVDFVLEADMVDESGPKPRRKEVTGVVPGTKYSLDISTIGYYNGCMPITFRVRLNDGRYAEGSIGADCGD